MGKWSAFLISLIPAALAGYLCFLLVTIGLPTVEEMGATFWVPLGAGFLATVMCFLAPFGILIFVKSAPKQAPAAAGAPVDEFEDNSDELFDDEVEELDSAGDLASDEFVSDELDSVDEFEFDDSSTDFQSAELASDEFSGELDEFDLDDEDDDDDLFA